MSEMVGYDGPIYMTHPTKAICPILLVRGVLVFCKSITDVFAHVILLYFCLNPFFFSPNKLKIIEQYC